MIAKIYSNTNFTSIELAKLSSYPSDSS